MGRFDRDFVIEQLGRSGLFLSRTNRLLGELLSAPAEKKIQMVVANATPIEPSLNGPEAILTVFAEQVFTGLAIIKTLLGAQEAVVAYPHKFHIDRASAQQWQVRCIPVSQKYPQAIGSCVLRTLQRQGHLPARQSAESSAIVFDIQLLHQIERLVFAERLPTERIVTMSGDGVEKPGHFIVPIGLKISHLLAAAGMYADSQCVISGCSMTGVSVDPAETIVSQSSESFVVFRRLRYRRPQRCLRCGWCIEDCPSRLDPAKLFHLAETDQHALTGRFGLGSCLECGICSYVCPAELGIKEHLVMMKRKLELNGADSAAGAVGDG